MSTIREKIEAMATEHGYSGGKTKTVNEALDALNDALAGSDQSNGDTIAKTIGSMSDNVGSGGGSSTPSIGNYLYDVSWGNLGAVSDGDVLQYEDVSIESLYTASFAIYAGQPAREELSGNDGLGTMIAAMSTNNQSNKSTLSVFSGTCVSLQVPSGFTPATDGRMYLLVGYGPYTVYNVDAYSKNLGGEFVIVVPNSCDEIPERLGVDMGLTLVLSGTTTSG